MTAPLAIGILGGMGPAATLDLFAKLLAASEAKRDQDHLRLIIDCNPAVPDRNAALVGQGPSPGAVLAAMAAGLERAGADVLVMACNAAHAYQADIERATTVPFISMIEETSAALGRRHPEVRRVGLLAADACLDARLYQQALAATGRESLTLGSAEQARFMRLLYRIKSGDISATARAEMRDLAGRLAEAGAEAILAGCTEVPLVLDAKDLSLPLIGATDILVEQAIAYARRRRALPLRRQLPVEPGSAPPVEPL